MNLWLTLFAEAWIRRLGWVLIHFIWQGMAIALLLALTLRLLARASSQVRYTTIAGALLICGVTPVATWMVLGSQSQPALPPAVASTIIRPSRLDLPATSDSNSYSNSTPASSVEGASQWLDRVYRAANAALPSAVCFWFGGMLILTLRLTWGWTVMRHMCRSGLPLQDALSLQRFRSLMVRMQIDVPIQLLESALVEVPTLIGWLRPTILVPASVLVGLTPDQLDSILAHELAHVRRHDYLVNLFQTVLETILFYHPAVWWISRKLREERENCCDDIALEVMADRLVYVSALVQLEEGRALPLALSASGGSLLYRIKRIVGTKDRKTSAWPLWILIIFLLSIGCLTKSKSDQDSPKTAAELISRLGRFVDGVNSMDYTTIEGDPKGDYSREHWQEMGGDTRIEIFSPNVGTDGKRAGNFHDILSYDGDHGYNYSPGSDRLRIQKDPFTNRTEGYYSGMYGPLLPFQFLQKREVFPSSGWVTLKTLKSRDALAAAAARALLVPDKNRSWNSHPCIAVKLSNGNDRWDSQAAVDFIAYFATDLDFYPIAYEIYKHGKISASSCVTKFTTLPLSSDGSKVFRYPSETTGFRYDSDTYHSSSGGGYGFTLTSDTYHQELKINTLTKADFTIKPPPGGYIEDLDSLTLIKVAANPPGAITSGTNTALTDSLVDAAKAGNLPEVERLLKQSGDPKVDQGSMVQDALRMAVVKNHPDIVKVLLQHGADPNQPDNESTSFLFEATNAVMLKVLLEGGANPNIADTFRTPLSQARDIESIRLLVKHGANLDPKLANGLTLVESAINSSTGVDVVNELIKQGAKFDPQGNGPGALARAAAWNDVQLIQMLLDRGVSPNAFSDEPLMQTSALHNAAWEPSPKAVKLLLERGANPAGDPRDEDTPLAAALIFGQTANVELLGKAGAHDVGDLSIAAARGDAAQVEDMLKNGANVNETDKAGITPLFYAARRAHLEIAKLLLAHGANVNQFNADGMTPFVSLRMMEMGQTYNQNQYQMDWNVSTEEGQRRMEAFKALFAKYPSDSNYRNAQGRTALHQMAFSGNTMVDILTGDKAHPADPNVQDRDGNTPLILAALSPHAKETFTQISIPENDRTPHARMKEWNAEAYIACQLIQAGAKLHLVVANGKTAGELAMAGARKANNPQLVSVLRDAGVAPPL